MRLTLLVEVIEDGRPVLLHLDYVLITYGQELNNLGEHAPSIRIDESRDDFVCDVARRCPQHFL